MKTIYYDLEITFLTMQENLTFAEIVTFNEGDEYLHLIGKYGERYWIPLGMIDHIETKIRFEAEKNEETLH